MQICIVFIIGIFMLSSFHPIKEIPDDEIEIDIGTSYSVPITLDVQSLTQIQKQNITEQNFDYSCGSAALATLLNFQLGENFTERQVINGLMEHGDKAKITQRRAFSLLDMKSFVNKLGYNGVGYKAELNDLLEIDRPGIIPIEFLGYRHFTVLRGLYDGHIFLADPYRGNTSYTIKQFQDMWYENVLFIVYPQGTRELSALKLTDQDLRYINEKSIFELISDYGPNIPLPDEDTNFFTLPDEYQKYRH